ncbi:hypothetical protein [Microvirgula aerodenitrificans]|uniref:hypothetical protein n=1 Tax=Microvirgula aerodenitrificans TaxID=57480 RepID=UPI00248E30E6|nr:hypothetical protein [Microvirgula aerodenitrificans]
MPAEAACSRGGWLARALLLLCLLPSAAGAGVVRDRELGFSIDLPPRWKLTYRELSAPDRSRAWIPSRRTDADRGRARIEVERRRHPGARKLEREIRRRGKELTAPLRIRTYPRPNHTELTLVEYRDGSYDRSGAWLVNRYLLAYLPVDGKTLMVARCQAAETDFALYRAQLEKSCLSLSALPR